METLVKKLQKLYDAHRKDYIGYCLDRSELDCKTREEAKQLLLDCSAEGDYENLAREQGHLAGINDAINIVKDFISLSQK